VVDADEDDDENAGTVILALMQKERRKKRKEGLDLLTIGYAVYKVSDGHPSFPITPPKDPLNLLPPPSPL